MKRNLLRIQVLGLTFAGIAFVNNVQAQNFGQFASAIFVSASGTSQTYNVSGTGASLIGPSNQNLPGDMGTYTGFSGSFRLTGTEVKTYKNPGANVCGVSYYVGYRQAGCSEGCGRSYTRFDLPFKADCNNGTFSDGYGPCSAMDQKWGAYDWSLNLTGWTYPDIELFMYYVIRGNSNDPNGCGEDVYVGSPDAPTAVGTYHLTAPAYRNSVSDRSNVLGIGGNATVHTYPSPVGNIVNIEAQNFDDGPVQMQVTNIQGATSKSISLPYMKGQNLTLDMSSYTAGIYFVRLQQGAKTAVARVVKQ